MSLAQLLLLAIKHLSFNITTSCPAISITYSSRLGSLLATDLSLWLVSSVLGNYTCYKGHALLPNNFPKRLSKELIRIAYSKLPKVKNVETLRILGRWYYVYIGSPKDLKGIYKELQKYDDIRAYFAFLILKYEYLKFLNKAPLTSLTRCNMIVVKSSNVTFKDAVGYVLMTVNPPLGGGNLKLTLNMLYSYLAYSMYYDKDLVPFIKSIIASTAVGACTPMEATLLTFCELSRKRLWECYASLKWLLKLGSTR